MEYTPTRKITNRGSSKNTGYFPSIKNKRPVAFESHIERDYIYLLEFDKDVVSYFEQPLKIKYDINNGTYTYIPDFLVNRTNKTQIIEIKPYNKLKKIMEDEKKRIKYVMAYKYCNANGYEFKIVTDINIRSGCLLENAKYLFAYSRLDVPASQKMLIRNLLITQGPTPIKNIINELSDSETDSCKMYSYILSLIYSHHIKTDMTKKISRHSIVWI
jgi:hypothetical protein